MESDVPLQFRTLNVVEVKYNAIFDPPETTILSGVLVSHATQLQDAKASGPYLSKDSSHETSTFLRLLPFWLRGKGCLIILFQLQPSWFES